MKSLAMLNVCILLLSVGARAQKPPTFSQYRVRVERIRSVKVDLSSKNARMYRTNLRNAAKGGVNFAGHYVITSWGCGINCNEAAIIDARNGKVYFPKMLEGIAYSVDSDDDELLKYKRDSKLLIHNHGGGDIDYFVWNGTTLRRIKFVKKSDTQ